MLSHGGVIHAGDLLSHGAIVHSGGLFGVKALSLLTYGAVVRGLSLLSHSGVVHAGDLLSHSAIVHSGGLFGLKALSLLTHSGVIHAGGLLTHSAIVHVGGLLTHRAIVHSGGLFGVKALSLLTHGAVVHAGSLFRVESLILFRRLTLFGVKALALFRRLSLFGVERLLLRPGLLRLLRLSLLTHVAGRLLSHAAALRAGCRRCRRYRASVHVQRIRLARYQTVVAQHDYVRRFRSRRGDNRIAVAVLDLNRTALANRYASRRRARRLLTAHVRTAGLLSAHVAGLLSHSGLSAHVRLLSHLTHAAKPRHAVLSADVRRENARALVAGLSAHVGLLSVHAAHAAGLSAHHAAAHARRRPEQDVSPSARLHVHSAHVNRQERSAVVFASRVIIQGRVAAVGRAEYFRHAAVDINTAAAVIARIAARVQTVAVGVNRPLAAVNPKRDFVRGNARRGVDSVVGGHDRAFAAVQVNSRAL